MAMVYRGATARLGKRARRASASDAVTNSGTNAGVRRSRGPGRKTTEERFWAKVSKSRTCHTWIGATNRLGQGVLRIENRLVLASRFSYQLHYGPIAKGAHIGPTCGNSSCVRAEHLKLTPADERRDQLKLIRRASMPRGEKRRNAKLSEDDVRDLRARYAVGACTMQNLADSYGVSLGAIHQIIHRKKWSHVK